MLLFHLMSPFFSLKEVEMQDFTRISRKSNIYFKANIVCALQTGKWKGFKWFSLYFFIFFFAKIVIFFECIELHQKFHNFIWLLWRMFYRASIIFLLKSTDSNLKVIWSFKIVWYKANILRFFLFFLLSLSYNLLLTRN